MRCRARVAMHQPASPPVSNDPNISVGSVLLLQGILRFLSQKNHHLACTVLLEPDQSIVVTIEEVVAVEGTEIR